MNDEPAFLLLIDYGKAPDWNEAGKAINGLQVPSGDGWTDVEASFMEQVEEYRSPTVSKSEAVSRARQQLHEFLGEVSEAYEEALKTNECWWDIREYPDRGIDVHILLGDDDNSAGLTGTGAAYALEDCGIFVAAGFDE